MRNRLSGAVGEAHLFKQVVQLFPVAPSRDALEIGEIVPARQVGIERRGLYYGADSAQGFQVAGT